MEKNILKMSAIIMIMLLMMFCISTTVEASNGFELPIDDSSTSPIDTQIRGASGNIIWVVQAVGYAAATIILAVLAIKYLAASPTDKAEIKKSAMIWVVGAIILFAGSFILTMIQTFSKQIEGGMI